MILEVAMKKRLLIFMCVLLAFSTLFSVHAEDSSIDDSDIKKITESYLENCAYNMYMYSDNDLKSSTILELSNDTVEKIVENVTLNNSKVACSDLKHNIDFVVEKCEYYKAIRSDQNIIRNDFKVVYNFNDVNINGSSAFVDVNESVNFYYDGIDIPSAIITNYNVALYKIEGQWYIIDITSDDPFDGMKKTDFSATDAIADYNSAKKQSAVKSDVTVELEVPEPVERSVVSSIRGYNNVLGMDSLFFFQRLFKKFN